MSGSIPSATPLFPNNNNFTLNLNSKSKPNNTTYKPNNSKVEMTKEQELELYERRFIDTCDKLYNEQIEHKQNYLGIEYISLNEDIEKITPRNFNYDIEDRNKLFKEGDKQIIKELFDESINFLDRTDINIEYKIEVLTFFIGDKKKLLKTIIHVFDCDKMFGKDIFRKYFPLREEYTNHYNDLASLYNVYETRRTIQFEDILINYGAQAFLKFLLRKKDLIEESVSKNSRRIGQGAYGKVYRSPIGYDDKSQIGKVFSTFRDWVTEYDIAEKLKDIPNDDGFIVLPKTISEINKKILQLRYGYAGESYKDYLDRCSFSDNQKIIIRRTKKSIKIMCDFLQRYLDTFGQSELTHLDIKPANVMYLEEDNTLRLIDFSLTTNEEQLFNRNPRRIIQIESSYPFWSPEYNLFMAGYKGQEIDENIIKKLTNAIIRMFRNGLFKMKIKQCIFDLLKKYKKDETYIYVKNSQDTWGIGITFLLYLETIFSKKSFSIHTHDLKQIEDFMNKIVDIICKNMICVNTDRNIEKCIIELQSISDIQGLNNVRTLFDI